MVNRKVSEVMVVLTILFLATGCVVMDRNEPLNAGYFVSSRTYIGRNLDALYYADEETLFHFSDSIVTLSNIYSGEIRNNSFRLSKAKVRHEKFVYFSESTNDAFVLNQKDGSIQIYKYDTNYDALFNLPYRRYQGLTALSTKKPDQLVVAGFK